MKLMVAIIQDYDVDGLLRAVTEIGLRATRIASLGGFLRTGNTTVLMGVDDDRVCDGLRLLHQTCRTRRERVATDLVPELAEVYASGIAEMTVGGGVVFVVDVSRFERIDW
jgi:uncharacterized protein YaaQ